MRGIVVGTNLQSIDIFEAYLRLEIQSNDELDGYFGRVEASNRLNFEVNLDYFDF